MVDQISAAVMQKKLKSITRQMAMAMIRSCRSLNLTEAKDFCTGIYGPDGGIWEQSEFIPIMAYTIPASIAATAEYFKEELYPGDVIIHNDPFTGGNQTSDVKIIEPVFYEGQLICFVAINAHQADVGGAVPGGYNPRAREIWQEALRITPVKIFERGRLRRDVWDLIFANIRLPIVKEDIMPMVGACHLGCRELRHLIDEHGLRQFNENLSYLFDASEASIREQLSSIPEGVYEAEHPVFDDGTDSEKSMKIKLRLSVSGGKVLFDYTGTSPQTAGYVNAPYAVTVSGSLFALLMCLENVFPKNKGMMRLLQFNIPEGTMLNPRFPAATGFGNHLTDQIGAVVMKALFQAIPERVTAGWNPLLCVMLSGYDRARQRQFADMLINACKGGSGATYGYDGWSHLGLIGGGGGITAQDPELFELENPVIFHHFEYAQDSGGAGRWRGGLGVETVVEITEDNIEVNVFGDGVRPEAAAFGLAGGKPASANFLQITLPTGERYLPNSKDLVGPLPKGTIIHQIAGGGGGYGPPEHRSQEQIEYDLQAGFVSEEAAKLLYGYRSPDKKKEGGRT
ncbi:MAG: hydantoinase B/oxoprolinase family protein [Thermacetogeniaceae bacterium]|nr:hydantoinase B/oxoprolinase family protein [Syntrophomonadaceae bacterium]